MSLLAYWTHDLNPVLFRIGDTLAVRWYGLAYVAGFATGAWLLWLGWKRRRCPLNPKQIEQTFVAVTIGTLAGGRIGSMLLYNLEAFAADPLMLFRVWEGGMASHGGFIGGMLGILYVSRQTSMPFLRISDSLAMAAPTGLFFGRLANFVNGELWGKPTDVAWAVIFPQSANAWEQAVPRHPSQLYEAGLEGIVLGAWIHLRYWLRKPGKEPDGRLGAEFLALYAILRIVGEQFREPDASLILGMSRGVFYSFFMLVAGLALWAWTMRKKASANRPDC